MVDKSKDMASIGCEHYQRKIEIYATCCQKWFSCHICHNEVSDHPIDRHLIQNIKCLLCQTEQKSNLYCINSKCELNNEQHKPFCHYACTICGLYSNDTDKQIYHCHGCGICRVGPADQYNHCDVCNLCYPISKNNHKCFQNRLDLKCAVCQDNLFDIRSTVSIFDKCNHAMCSPCYSEYVKNSYKCPICRKSIYDLSIKWSEIDMVLLCNELPEPYNSMKSNILCADCDLKSIDVKFDFEYHKCQHCGSYNTNLIDISTSD